MQPKRKYSRWYKVIILGITLLLVYTALKVYVGPAPQADNLNDWQKYNDSLNIANKAFAENHPYNFTDRPRKEEKDSSIFRIAVLGDSFIWGDGLPYDSAWSHKLEQKLLAKYQNVEVMHWGRNGWQTKEEIEFYTTKGYKFHPDLLILGFVDNDADMGRFQHMHWDFRNNYWIFYKIWPALAEKILSKLYANSYHKWQLRLYGEENIAMYKVLWKQFMDKLATDGQDYFVVQTPACITYTCDEFYLKVQPMFDTLNLEYINLIPATQVKLSNYTYEELLANPANYHPGTLMTNVFADEVLEYIEKTERLPTSHLKQP
jgi:lysophospholipase L1-like esterase